MPRRNPRAGRKPLPNAVKKLTGSEHVNTQEMLAKPINADNIPCPPAILNKYGKDCWNFLCNTLGEFGILAETDQGIMLAYCKEWERFLSAEKKLKNRPLYKTLKNSTIMQNIYLKISRDAQNLLFKYAIEMGLTPSSRAKLKADNPAGKKDDVGDLFD